MGRKRRSVLLELLAKEKPPPHGPGRRRGTHALRKRCPVCRKMRRFFEPPGDQGGEREPRQGWVKIDGRWVCTKHPTKKT